MFSFLFNDVTNFSFTSVTQVDFEYFFSFVFDRAFFNDDVIFFKGMRLN